MGVRIDLTGKRFGRLVVVSLAGKRNKHGHCYWNCVCDCGGKKCVLGDILRSGNTKSCGCLKKEKGAFRLIDLTGKRFGRLVVVSLAGKRGKQGKYYWDCVCDCGGKKIVNGYSLRSGSTKSCGCLNKEKGASRFIDLTGKRFGRFVVVSLAGKRDKYGQYYWNCVCDCGEKKIVSGRNLRSGSTKSCGCLNKELLSDGRVSYWLRMGTTLTAKDIPPELIEVKKMEIILKRELKNEKNGHQ